MAASMSDMGTSQCGQKSRTQEEQDQEEGGGLSQLLRGARAGFGLRGLSWTGVCRGTAAGRSS